MKTSSGLKVSKRKLKGLLQNTEKSAEVINLVYVSDKDPGIERSRRGENFIYTKNGGKITDKNDLLRIRKLVLPPHGKNVWICNLSNGLAGDRYDVKERNNINIILVVGIQKPTLYQLLEFGKKLPPCVSSLPGSFKPGFAIDKGIGKISRIQYSCGQ